MTTFDSSDAAAAAGPRSKCDQVILEAICKACEIIVSSRSSSITANSFSQQRFNLRVPEITTMRQILKQHDWRPLPPLVADACVLPWRDQ